MGFMLTTKDNPHDPFTRFDDWLEYDEGKGYYTCEYLDRMSYTSNEMSQADQELLLRSAADRIVDDDPTGMYKIVEH